MQTFLPFPSFNESLSCLDRQRLGKQRVEAFQILTVLRSTTASAGWRNHPAVLMWRGYEDALTAYYNASLTIWEGRGYRNIKLQPIPRTGCPRMPPWFGNVKFHRSHQSNLLRKNADHYRIYFPDVPDNLPYVWPTKEFCP